MHKSVDIKRAETVAEALCFVCFAVDGNSVNACMLFVFKSVCGVDRFVSNLANLPRNTCVAVGRNTVGNEDYYALVSVCGVICE